jgi:oligogalacturonide lyase
VVRLSQEPGSASCYFHQNAYTSEGDKLLISTPEGLATVALTKNWALNVVVPRSNYGAGGSSGLEIGRKSRQVYYSVRGEAGTLIRATHLDTKETRDVVQLPFFASFNGVNADETQLIGTMSERRPGGPRPAAADATASGAAGGQPSPGRRSDFARKRAWPLGQTSHAR